MNKSRLEKEVEDLRNEVETLDLMLNSLVDVIEKKGIIRQQEWKQRIKEQLDSK